MGPQHTHHGSQRVLLPGTSEYGEESGWEERLPLDAVGWIQASAAAGPRSKLGSVEGGGQAMAQPGALVPEIEL